MILIASSDNSLALKWQNELKDEFLIYDVIINDRPNLDLCIKKQEFEVLIIDKVLLDATGVHELSDIRAVQPNLHIILMTDEKKDREEISAILFGAKAYLEYSKNIHLLPKIVKAVMANELWVDRKFVTRLLDEIEDITEARHAEAQRLDRALAKLTPRELQIAVMVATGTSNRKVAEELSISERTVKAHLGVIFRKIGITDRLQLALYMNRYKQLSSIWHETTPPPSKQLTPQQRK